MAVGVHDSAYTIQVSQIESGVGSVLFLRQLEITSALSESVIIITIIIIISSSSSSSTGNVDFTCMRTIPAGSHRPIRLWRHQRTIWRRKCIKRPEYRPRPRNATAVYRRSQADPGCCTHYWILTSPRRLYFRFRCRPGRPARGFWLGSASLIRRGISPEISQSTKICRMDLCLRDSVIGQYTANIEEWFIKAVTSPSVLFLLACVCNDVVHLLNPGGFTRWCCPSVCLLVHWFACLSPKKSAA